MDEALKNLIQAIDTERDEDLKTKQKQRKELREFIDALCGSLDYFKKQKLSDMPDDRRKKMMTALNKADEMLKTLNRALWEPAKDSQGRRVDRLTEPLESNQVWVLIERLKRQASIVGPDGEFIKPPAHDSFRSEDRVSRSTSTGERVRDTAIVINKRKIKEKEA